MKIDCIDVSHFDEGISLHQAKQDHPELRGLIAKATQGVVYVDSAFADFRLRAQQMGLKFSSYHFLTTDPSGAQWAHFAGTVGDRSDLEMLVLDIEQNDEFSDWEGTGIGDAAVKGAYWLNDALATGHKTCLYMDEDYWNRLWPHIASKLGERADEIIRWVATYEREPSVAYDLWQWSDAERVGGKAAVDVNQVNPAGRLA